MADYCNATTDLYRIYPRIEEFKISKTLRGWSVYSGSVYKLANVGYAEKLIENGTQMTSVASIALIDAVGKYFYDSDADIIYARATSGNVSDAANVYRWGLDWDTFKSWAVTRASERVDALLDRKFPIPVPENPQGSSTAKWDGPLIDATAYFACSFVVGRSDPPKYNTDGSAANLAAELFLAGQAIIRQYNDGDMRFGWEITADEAAGYNIIATTGNTSVGMFQLRGDYNGGDDDEWMIKISTGGALGTAAFQLSEDNGTTYNTAATTSITWQSLANGVEIRFFGRGGGSSSFILSDTWQLLLTAKDRALTRSRLGSGSLVA